MDPDWDLSAVVRSCSSTMSPRFPPTADRAFSTTDKPVAEEEEEEEPLACLASLTFEDDDDSHLLRYPDMSQPEKYGSLSQSYPPFFTSTPTNSGTNPSDLVNPPSSTSLLGVSIVADHVCHLDPHAGTSGIAPSQPTSASPPLVFLHRPPNYQQQPQQLVGPPKRRSPAVSRATVPHPPRPKKLSRKSLLKRTVTHVTADNLSSDQWSWRKYGQKPIKGSPHPRNYYRCSSSKGCSARKQVELSKSDPDMYVVTYTGDHTHPRPNYRNSLAGSTRNRVGSAPRLAAEAMEGSSSSLLSATSSTVGTGEASSAQYAEVEDNQVDEETEEMVAAKKTMDVESEDDDEDLLIPNLVLDDDLFKGLKELSGGGFGQSPSFEDNFSSGSSAGGAAARSG